MQKSVAESAIISLLPSLLSHPVSAVRHAATWTAINLLYVPAGASDAFRRMVCSHKPRRVARVLIVTRVLLCSEVPALVLTCMLCML